MVLGHSLEVRGQNVLAMMHGALLTDWEAASAFMGEVERAEK